MHDDGVIQSQAVLIRYRHQPVRSEARLGVKLPNRESHSSWRDFLFALE